MAILWQSAIVRRGDFLPDNDVTSDQCVYVLAAIVCWAHGEEYGADTLFMDDESHEMLENYLDKEMNDWMESHW
jgi:hypothetical protein